MAQIQEYPKIMRHPQYTPAEYRQLEGKGKGLFAPDTVMSKPERFPNVTVTNLKEEQQYAAKGYRPNSMPDPAAYEEAILGSKVTNGYAFQPFPKWKYHAMKVPVIVKDEDEELALGAGWSDTPIIATEEDVIEAKREEVARTPAPAQPAMSTEAKPERAAAPASKSKAKKKPTKKPGPGKGYVHHAAKQAG